jgi:hypothetical protein
MFKYLQKSPRRAAKGGDMPNHDVTVFKPVPLTPGQKIRIEDSPRAGDWEVVKITEHKLILRCPISKVEIKCDRFCYLMEEKQNEPWPRE